MLDSDKIKKYNVNVKHPDWKKDLANIREEIARESDTFGERLRHFKNSSGLNVLQTLLVHSGMNRDVVQRIRDDRTGKIITKSMALSLLIAAHTPLSLAEDALEAAGYCLSPCILYDRIIKYFIQHEGYDFEDINRCLNSFGIEQKYWLGSKDTKEDIYDDIEAEKNLT